MVLVSSLFLQAIFLGASQKPRLRLTSPVPHGDHPCHAYVDVFLNLSLFLQPETSKSHCTFEIVHVFVKLMEA